MSPRTAVRPPLACATASVCVSTVALVSAWICACGAPAVGDATFAAVVVGADDVAVLVWSLSVDGVGDEELAASSAASGICVS